MDARPRLSLKLLKLINILTKLAINIGIDDCQEKLEKDEKLEQLRHVSGGERLTAQNLGSRYDPSSAPKRDASKKTPPPIPPVVAL